MKKGNSGVAKSWVEKGLGEKDPQKKLHYLELALELDPANITALNSKGMLLHKKGEFNQAIECYDRILKQYNMSGFVPALFNKSLALKKLGKTEAALNLMKRAVKQQPENEKIKKHFEELKGLTEGNKVTNKQEIQQVAAKDLAVNQIYDRWEAPAVSTLLAHSMKCSKREIKYYKGFGEDLIKEKIIQENLHQKVYSCKSCRFFANKICQHKETKSMAVSPDAICRNFRPAKNKKE
ncbi:MAG: tetratricopeptide repeat protein [Methanolobus sp.]